MTELAPPRPAGIFVLTGNAAASFAGPAVLVSFVLAGLACGCAALCHAELASTMRLRGPPPPYTSLGESLKISTPWPLRVDGVGPDKPRNRYRCSKN